MLRTDIIYYYKHDREILIKYYETWTKSYALFYVSKTNKMTQKWWIYKESERNCYRTISLANHICITGLLPVL